MPVAASDTVPVPSAHSGGVAVSTETTPAVNTNTVPTTMAAATTTATATATTATLPSSNMATKSSPRRPSTVPSNPPIANNTTTTTTTTTTTSRSKKKKKGPQGNSNNNQEGGSGLGNAGENTGRWTAEEHRLFLQGLEQHGKGWKKIASLIKSRTVVQIRTHAQKYFQKLAKARQNGEEGEIIMEGRGGVASVTSASSGAAVHMIPKRRRQITGTKRKAIQSVVASAQRQGKKLMAAQVAAAASATSGGGGVPNPMAPLPAVAPALVDFVLPPSTVSIASSSASSEHQDNLLPGTLSGPVLEDSLYRFLTPCPPLEHPEATTTSPHVNHVARQAGANPIVLPSGNTTTTLAAAADNGGEISPTGVNDLSIYPAWTDTKETPSWYAKGADVDALLDVADTLDWLADSGDLNESYEPQPIDTVPSIDDTARVPEPGVGSAAGAGGVRESTSVSTLPHVDSNVETMVPSLPSLFQNESAENLLTSAAPSSSNLKSSASATNMMDTHLSPFDSVMEEHAFVSTILEEDQEDTTDCLPSLT